MQSLDALICDIIALIIIQYNKILRISHKPRSESETRGRPSIHTTLMSLTLRVISVKYFNTHLLGYARVWQKSEPLQIPQPEISQIGECSPICNHPAECYHDIDGSYSEEKYALHLLYKIILKYNTVFCVKFPFWKANICC